MNKRLLFSLIAFALGPAIAGYSQTSAVALPGNLELVLTPTNIQGDVPQAFSFVLVNKSDHDVRFPTPSIGCSNALHGSIQLRLTFTPLKPAGDRGFFGCVADSAVGSLNVLDQAKGWKILHAGETLRLQANRMQLKYEDQELGTYEFWAEYAPRYLSEADQKTLTEEGIDFPHRKIISAHAIFQKSQ